MERRRLKILFLAARKLAGLAVTFVVVSLLLFLSIRAIPGDPVALRLKNPDPELVARERERLGLDLPWPAQFWRQTREFWRGDWGRSFATGRPVREDVKAFLPATLELSVAAMVLGTLFGAFWALAAELIRRRAVRWISHSIGMVGLTVPIFWIGLLLLLAGSLWLGWFPPGGRLSGGMNTPGWTGFLLVDSVLAGRWELWRETVWHLFLPAVCLSVYPAAQVCATLRARLEDERLRGLLTALRARGFGAGRIWLVHVLKLLAAPVVTIVGTTFGILIGGAVLTEMVFSWPGMGRYLVTAVLDRDIYVIQNALLLVVFLVLAVVQVSELGAAWLNPVLAREDEK